MKTFGKSGMIIKHMSLTYWLMIRVASLSVLLMKYISIMIGKNQLMTHTFICLCGFYLMLVEFLV